MIKSRWFYHPLFIFIFSLLALALSLFLYIRTYLQVNEALQEVVVKYNLNQANIFRSETWIFILILSLLVAVIVAGLLIIYIYYQKMIQLYRLQQNFINGFTHELKTPIASLQLFLDTFSKHELSRSDQLKYLDFMKRDTKRLSENVSRILHLGRLEDRNFKADFQEDNLVGIIENIVENSRHLFDEGVIVFKKEVDQFVTHFDKSLIEMVIMNLIINGFIYNNKKEKLVTIELKGQGDKLLVSFTDNGIGLEEKEFKRIFKKFYQVGKTTKGSGVGLYIVGQILKIHKSHIKVAKSDLNVGTTFEVSFKKI